MNISIPYVKKRNFLIFPSKYISVSRMMMFLVAVLLFSLFFLPIWKIVLIAPQYPEPLGLDIHIDHLSDGVQFYDVKNIDLLNHYIGMAPLPTEENVANGKIEPLLEFVIFPIVILVMIFLALVFALFGKSRLYLIWFSIMVVLCLIGLYDFYQWLYIYGHDLDLNAILKITDPITGKPMGYQPPFIGYKKILNFEVFSFPAMGTFNIAFAMLISFSAYIINTFWEN